MYSESVIHQVRHFSCCTKRQVFNGLDATEIGRQRLVDKYGEDGEPMVCYYCVFCNMFHIGRRPKATVLLILEDLESLLRYDFNSACPTCGGLPGRRSQKGEWCGGK